MKIARTQTVGANISSHHWNTVTSFLQLEKDFGKERKAVSPDKMAIDIFEKTNPEVFVLSGFFFLHNLKNRLDVIFWGFVFLFLLMHSGRVLFCVRHFNIFVCYFVFFTCKSSNEARNNKWSCKQLSSNPSDETARFFFSFLQYEENKFGYWCGFLCVLPTDVHHLVWLLRQ